MVQIFQWAKRRVYIQECANTTFEGFWLRLQTKSLHLRAYLYNFQGDLGALSDGNLTSRSLLIQVLRGPRVRLRMERLHEGFGVRLQKESLHLRVCLCPIKRNLFLIELMKGKCRCFCLVILTCSTHGDGNEYSKHSGLYMRPP